MKKYLSLVKRQMNQNFTAKFVQIPREKNKQANRLAKAVSAEHMTIGSQVLSFIQHSSTIKEIEVQVIPNRTNQIALIVSYLKNGMLLDDHNTSRKMKVRVLCFVLIRDVLYKRDFSCSYLRCFVPNKADYVMREVNEGVCKNHTRV